MFKARIIKSEGCFKCKNYLKSLNKQGYDFIIYDADLKENQPQLDLWKINAMPVVQIVKIKEDNNIEMVFQFPPGSLSTRLIETKITELKKKNEK